MLIMLLILLRCRVVLDDIVMCDTSHIDHPGDNIWYEGGFGLAVIAGNLAAFYGVVAHIIITMLMTMCDVCCL